LIGLSGISLGVEVKVSPVVGVGTDVKLAVAVSIGLEDGLDVIVGPPPEINKHTKIVASKGHSRVF
jgi:hypothetical protein